MKRLLCSILALGMLCSLAGCGEKGLPQPNFPLEEEVVLAAMEQAGLEWILAEDETQAFTEEHILYTFQHPTETFSAGNPLTIAFVSSVMDEGKRFMQMNFESVRVPEAPEFSWEDWKQQLVFSALLYGGFTDEEAVYNALSAQDTPEAKDGTVSTLREKYIVWDGVELPGGYCRVKYRMRETASASSPTKWGSSLSVFFYESKAHYEKIQAEAQAQKEAIDKMTPEEKMAYQQALVEKQREAQEKAQAALEQRKAAKDAAS